ncbi:MAG: hypothetical protein P9M14_06095 [Candidatus Alcyoniella australis]|nr:hypothetical protein [Candidatus Alcyoniella australis]
MSNDDPQLTGLINIVLGGFGLLGALLTYWMLLVLAPRSMAQFAAEGLDLPTLTQLVMKLGTLLRTSMGGLIVICVLLCIQGILAYLGVRYCRRSLTIANTVVWGLWLIASPLTIFAIYMPTL